VLALASSSQVSIGNFHGKMNGAIFIKWLKKLILNLPAHSVVVINYAPYHTICNDKFPTQSSTKV
jgi:transposase